MARLTKEAIKVLHDLENVLDKSPFRICKMEITDNVMLEESEIILIDIRRFKEIPIEEKMESIAEKLRDSEEART